MTCWLKINDDDGDGRLDINMYQADDPVNVGKRGMMTCEVTEGTPARYKKIWTSLGGKLMEGLSSDTIVYKLN